MAAKRRREDGDEAAGQAVKHGRTSGGSSAFRLSTSTDVTTVLQQLIRHVGREELQGLVKARWTGVDVMALAPPDGVAPRTWLGRLLLVGHPLPEVYKLQETQWRRLVEELDDRDLPTVIPAQTCRGLVAAALRATRVCLNKTLPEAQQAFGGLAQRSSRTLKGARGMSKTVAPSSYTYVCNVDETKAPSAALHSTKRTPVIPLSPPPRGGAGAGAGAGASASTASAAAAAAGAAAAKTPSVSPGVAFTPHPERRYNIVFILTDQERYMKTLPPGMTLPNRDRLKERGVFFTNHHIASAVCSSSRSVIYTGQHIQRTRIFDNCNFPWVDNLPHTLPTLGTMMRSAGLYSAYKGKWHLSRELGTEDEDALPAEMLRRTMESYGFSDYKGIGDVVGHTNGGYSNDDMIGEQACRWLRRHALKEQHDNKRTPFFLAVNLVNPHDTMFFNTDKEGEAVQAEPAPIMHISPAPPHEIFKPKWRVEVPKSLSEPLDKEGRPTAHSEFVEGMSALCGDIPTSHEWRWKKLLNFYHNCIRHSDTVVGEVLDTLEVLGMADNTIVVMTSDHGELGGAHGMVDKGPTAYKEQNHVPLIVSHPGFPATHGQRCNALTSHLDLAPSMLEWASPRARRSKQFALLPGRSLTAGLRLGASAPLHAVRPAALYCFNMLAFVDSELMTSAQDFKNNGGRMQDMWMHTKVPDLSKRGALRSVFDGRFKFSRYFAPTNHHTPTTFKQLVDNNDLELFDTEADPEEVVNLAAGITEDSPHAAKVMEMNAKINELLRTEVKVPDELPEDLGMIQWNIINFDV